MPGCWPYIKALGVETVYETTTIPQAVNYNSDKIFDTRFSIRGFSSTTKPENIPKNGSL